MRDTRRNLGMVVTGLVLLGIALLGGTALGSGEPGTLTAWSLPNANSLPGGIVAAGGSVYFTEAGGNRIGLLDVAANTITEWDVGQGPERLALGSSNGVYFAERWADRIGRIYPSGNYYSSESSGTSPSGPMGLVMDVSGTSFWYTQLGSTKVTHLTPGGLLFDVLQVKAPAVHSASPSTSLLLATSATVAPNTTPGNPYLPPAIAIAPRDTSGPYTEWSLPSGTYHLRDLAIASDGTLYITTESGSLLELNPASNTVLFHDLPAGATSLRVAVDPAGRVWFTESWEDKIGRLDPATGEVVEWSVASGGQPYALCIAADGSVWFSQREGDKIGHLEPATNALTEYKLAANSHPLDVTFDASGQLWFTTERGNWIGRLAVGPILGPPPVADSITDVHVALLSATQAQVTVDYTYSGSHGTPVFAGGLPTVGGGESGGFGYVPEAIPAAGSGSVSFDLTYLGAGCTLTDGMDVYIYDAGRTTFLFYHAAVPMSWGPCVSSGSSSGLPTVSVGVDRGCGGAYDIGSPVTISVTPSETVTATLIDFETGGTQKQVSLGLIPAGATRTVSGTITGPAGVEGVVVMAHTTSGTWVSAGCVFAIGGASASAVSVSVDRGGGAVYHYGETATAILQSSVVGVARLYQVTRDGRIAGVTTAPILPGVTERIAAPINGTAGTSTFLLQVTSVTGQVLAATCSYEVIP
jgi:streptogramin lyase